MCYSENNTTELQCDHRGHIGDSEKKGIPLRKTQLSMLNDTNSNVENVAVAIYYAPKKVLAVHCGA